MFYDGGMKGAWESGRFSAEHGLKGVYKVFIRLGSAQFLINKASTVLPTYYEPSEIKVVESGDKRSLVHITKFDDADEVIDNRIGGWMERVIEISGYTNVNVRINRSISRGDPFTEFQVSWE